MKIKIIAPMGCDRSMLDERSWTIMKEGSTVRDALRLIKCSPIKAKMLLVSVNGERMPLNTELHDGDVVGFFSPISGG